MKVTRPRPRRAVVLGLLSAGALAVAALAQAPVLAAAATAATAPAPATAAVPAVAPVVLDQASAAVLTALNCLQPIAQPAPPDDGSPAVPGPSCGQQQVTFAASTPQLAALTPGSFLVSGVTPDAPDGFLIDVQQITTDANGGITVTGPPAPVSSVLPVPASGSAGSSSASPAAAVAPQDTGQSGSCDQNPDLSGLETTKIASLPSQQSVNLRDEQVGSQNLWIKGKINYTLDTMMGVSPGRAIGLPGHGYAFATWLQMNVTSESLTVYSNPGQGTGNPLLSGIKWSGQVGSDISFPPATVLVPVGDVVVPVVVVPKLFFQATVQGGFQVGATVTANFGLTTLSGIGYDPDQGWEQICSAQTSDAGGSATPFAFTSAWDMKVGIAADLEASFYGTGGVFVGVRPFLEGVAQIGNPYFVGYWGVDVTSGTRFDIGGEIATFPFVPTFRQQIPQLTLTLPPPSSPTPTPTPPAPTPPVPTPTPTSPAPSAATPGTVYIGLHDAAGGGGPQATRTGTTSAWHDTTCAADGWHGATTVGGPGSYATQSDDSEAWATGTGTTTSIQWWTAGSSVLSPNTDYAVYADIDTCNAGTAAAWYTLAGNDGTASFGSGDSGQRNVSISQAATNGYVYLGTENSGSQGLTIALVNGGTSGQVGAADIKLVKTTTTTTPPPTPAPTPTPTPTPTGAPPVLPPPAMAGTVYVGLHDSLGSPNGPVGTRTGDSGVWHDTTCTNNWTGQTTTGSFGAYSTQPDSAEAWASGTGTTSGIQWWTAGMDILSANTDYAVYADIDTCNAATSSAWYTLAGNDDNTSFGGPDVTGQRNVAINQAAASGYVYLGTANTGSNGISVALVNGGASGQVGAADIRLVKTGTSASPPAGPTYAAPCYDDGCLLRDANQDTVYLMHGGARWAVPTPWWMDTLHLSWSNVRVVAPGTVEQIPLIPANRTLVSDYDTGRVYVIFAGQAYHVPDPAAMTNWGFSWSAVQPMWSGFLAPNGIPIAGDLAEQPPAGGCPPTRCS